MIKLYNKSGEFCFCDPEQIENMKNIGYILDANPNIAQEQAEIIVEQVIEQTEEKPKKSKKDIIL